FFNFLGLWDSYLSAALYSGNTIDADIFISPSVHDRCSEDIQRYFKAHEGYYAVDLDEWSMDELNVPAYPARRVYRRIARSFCALAEDPDEVVLIIHEPPDWRTGERQKSRENCKKLHCALLGAPLLALRF